MARDNELKLIDLETEILELWKSGKFPTKTDLARHITAKYGIFGISEDSDRRSISRIISMDEEDLDLITSNVKLAKQRQKLQDTNRIERKAFREHARIENAVSAYGESLVRELTKYGTRLSNKISIEPLIKHNHGNPQGIIHLTDIHANELINLAHNQYNWTILSKRLRKLINESLDYFRFRDVSKVVFVCTGDLLNSDRRLDELMSQSTNRAKASVMMAHLLIQAILDVRNRGFEVDIVSVLGNESRVGKEMTFSNEAFSDNYDFTILSMAKIGIEAMNIEGVTFGSIDTMELVIDFGEQKWLAMHDITKVTDTQAKAQSTIGRYAASGVRIDFIIGGHIHAFRGTDISCRSGSMAGSNTYNEHALNLIGRASGVCYVVDGKDRYYQYIDLQNPDNEGYDIESSLKTYHTKSEDKLKPQVSIHKIVI